MRVPRQLQTIRARSSALDKRRREPYRFPLPRRRRRTARTGLLPDPPRPRQSGGPLQSPARNNRSPCEAISDPVYLCKTGPAGTNQKPAHSASELDGLVPAPIRDAERTPLPKRHRSATQITQPRGVPRILTIADIHRQSQQVARSAATPPHLCGGCLRPRRLRQASFRSLAHPRPCLCR